MLEEEILEKYHNVAVVGASPNPERPSYRVAKYLSEHGYNIFPVNPNVREILGLTSYKDLSSIPEKVEVVDIFRRSEEVMQVVEEAIKIEARVVWMQTGIINEEAARKARDAGLMVVMDRCMLEEHESLSRKRTS